MVAIFAGAGAGVERSSANTLGGLGQIGNGAVGRGGENVSVNAATGNLVISRQDEFLTGKGLDLGINRTYNSLSDVSGGDRDNGDGWHQSTTLRVFGLTGVAEQAGSTIKRLGSDGSVIVYDWEERGGEYAYWAEAGAGTHDRIDKSGSQWIWTDGDSQVTQTYDQAALAPDEYRIIETRDLSGHTLTYTYQSGSDRLHRVTTENGEWVEYTWAGNNLSSLTTRYVDLHDQDGDGNTTEAFTISRVSYGYDSSNRLTSVTTDLTPENGGDSETYTTNYTYDGTSDRVASIFQDDGSQVLIGYEAGTGRVTAVTHKVDASTSRTTEIGYGVGVTSVTSADGSVARLWHDSEGRLVQLMMPTPEEGGEAPVQQFEYDADGNLLRMIETTGENGSAPGNLVKASSWADGEFALRGDNLVDDSGWPQDIDGTHPPAGSIGQNFNLHAYAETEWVTTAGPYGEDVVSLHTGQSDSSDPGGGAYSPHFDIDKTQAYEFSIYVKADELLKHQTYFGLSSGVVKNGFDGAYNGNPYFVSSTPGESYASGWAAGKWVKMVGYVLPDGSAYSPSGSYGGIYDVETGQKIQDMRHYIWDGSQSQSTTYLRFYNYYSAQVPGKFTHWVRPEVRQVHSSAILKDGDALDIEREEALFNMPNADGWTNTPFASSDNEARWSSVYGPEGGRDIALETGQFDLSNNGGGHFTNQFAIDGSKAYKVTQYFRKTDISRHTIYIGIDTWGTDNVIFANNGGASTNPLYIGWTDDVQSASIEEDKWYKFVGYILPEGTPDIVKYSLGGVYDTETGNKVSNVSAFRWNENRTSNEANIRFFTYHDETEHGWSTDWLDPEVVALDMAAVDADNADPFGVVYDEAGRVTQFEYDDRGNTTKVTDPNGNTTHRFHNADNNLVREEWIGPGEELGDVVNTDFGTWTTNNLTLSSAGQIDGYDAQLVTSQPDWTSFHKTVPVETGDTLAFEVSLQAVAGSSTTQALGWHSPTMGNWGSSSESVAQIISGPGTITQDGGGLWVVDGLSTTEATRVRILREATADTTVQAHIYIDRPGGYGVGEQLIVAGPQITLRKTESVSRFAYDSNGRLRYEIGPEGEITEYRYSDGMLWTVSAYTDLAYPGTELAPTEAAILNWLDTHDRSQKRYSVNTYDARGNLIRTTNYGAAMANGSADTNDGYSEHNYTYDQAGQLLSRRTASLGTETFVYDGLGRIVSSVDTANNATTIVFDDAAGKTIITNARGYHTAETYNRAGELIASARGTTATGGTTGDSETAQYTYDEVGQLRIMTDERGDRTFYLYDAAGRQTAVITEDLHLTEYRYDDYGRVIQTVSFTTAVDTAFRASLEDPYSDLAIGDISPNPNDPYDIWSSTVYDAGGRVVQTIDGTGAVVAFEYDQAGNVIRTTAFANTIDPAPLRSAPALTPVTVTPDATNDIVLRSFYDLSGRKIGALDGEGYLTEMVYDDVGQIIRETAYAGQVPLADRASGTFSELQAAVAASNADNRSVYFVYDGQGQLRFTVDEESYVSESKYWLTSEWHAVGLVREQIVYATAISPGGDYSYDAIGALVASAANPSVDRKTSFEYDASGRVTESTDPVGLVTTYDYDEFGNAEVVTQKDGGALRTSYNIHSPNGRLVYTVDAEGFVARFDYDKAGNITRERVYDSSIAISGTPTEAYVSGQVSAADSSQAYADTLFTYDNQGRVFEATNAEGEKTRQYYNPTGWNYHTISAFGTADETKNLVHNDAAGRTTATILGYTETNSQLNGAGGEEIVLSNQYDAFGRATRVTDGEGVHTDTVYDRRGLVTQVTEGVGTASARTTSYEYNAFGEVVKVTDPRGNSTYTHYDDLGRVTHIVDAEDYITKTTYTAFSEVETVTRYHNEASGGASVSAPPSVVADANEDAVTTFQYDSAGRLIQTTDAEGFVETYGYNRFGDRTWKIGKSESVNNADGADNTTTYTYDKRGLLISETLPVQSYDKNGIALGAVSNSYSYDARGNQVSMTEAVGRPEARTTTYVYDKVNRLIETRGQARTVYDQTAHTQLSQTYVPVETIAYDERGNITRTVDASGAKTVFFYDDLNRKVVEIDALGTYSAYEYDDNGNVERIRVFATQVSVPSDGGSQEEAPTAPSGLARETRFEYDALNRMTKSSVILPSGYETGVLGGTQASPSWSASTPTTLETVYEYDANGNVIRTVDPNGNQTFAYYDALGRKTAQVDSEGYLTKWDYDSDGNVFYENSYAEKVGSAQSISLTASLSVDQLVASVQTSSLTRQTRYSYDRVGNRTEERRYNALVHDGYGGTVLGTGHVQYTYNGLGQVVTKTEATGDKITYEYDASGRLTEESRLGAGFAYGYLGYNANDPQNATQLTPTLAYSYDGLGNLTRSEASGGGGVDARVTQYEYNDGGLLSKMTDAEGHDREYFYDKSGRQIVDQYTRTEADGTTSHTEASLTKYDQLGRVIEQKVARKVGSAWQTDTSATGNNEQINRTEYNAFGDVVRTGTNGRWPTENKYDLAGRMWASNAGDGIWKFFGYDKNGNQTIAVTSAGEDLSSIASNADFAIDSFAGVRAISELDVNATYTEYDARNMAIKVIEEQRQLSSSTTEHLKTLRTYNAFGEVKTETDARGATLTYSYNTMGRMTRSEGPEVEITDESGASYWIKPSEDFYYDRAGRLVAKRDASEQDAGAYATTGTNASNAVSKAADKGHLTQFELLAGTGYGGSEALITKQINADGGITRTHFDVHGDARKVEVLVTGNESSGTWRTTTQEFDKLGRLTKLTQPNGLIQNFEYDELGQRTAEWNSFQGSGNKQTTDYDKSGRTIKTRAYGGDVTEMDYNWLWYLEAVGAGYTDVGGWQKTTTYENNRTLTQTSDAFGRAMAKNDLGSNNTTYSYDAAGRQIISSITRHSSNGGGSGTATYTYLNTGQIGTNTNLNGVAAYEYDAAGNRTAEDLVKAGVTIKDQTASYDLLGRMTQWDEAGTATSPAAYETHSYDANGNIRRTQSSFYELQANGNKAANPTTADHWFRFDSMNRVVLKNGDLVGATIERADGQEFHYNQAGERVASLTSFDGVTQEVDPDFDWYSYGIEGGEIDYVDVYYTGTRREGYSYDAAGNLVEIDIAETPVYVDSALNVTVGSLPTGGVKKSSFAYDLLGRQTDHKDYQTSTTNSVYHKQSFYNAKGQLIEDQTSTSKDDGHTYVQYNRYDYGVGSNYALGQVVQMVSDTFKNGSDNDKGDNATRYFFDWYDGAVQKTIQHDTRYRNEFDDAVEGNGSARGMQQGATLTDFFTGDGQNYTTTHNYNAFGQLTSANVQDGIPKNVTFTLDEAGQIIRREEARTNGAVTQTGNPEEVWYRFAGAEMGYTGNNGTSNLSTPASIAERTARAETEERTGTFRGGKNTGGAYIDGTGIDGLNSYYQGSRAGTYTVRGGESLQQIAASTYGDSNLWYKIAAANGLSGSETLVAGTTLRMPAGVVKSTHSASSFKPYDPGEAIGELSPTTPKPAKGAKCGAFGQILLAVVAIAAAKVIGPFSAKAFGKLGGLIGGKVGGLVAGVGQTVTTAALSDAAKQGVGIATGLQDGFSWNSVGSAALRSLFVPQSTGNVVRDAINGVFAEATYQGVAVATGLQKRFDWAGVAAAGVGNATGAQLGGVFNDARSELARLGQGLAVSAASALSQAATRSAINGDSFGRNIEAALPNVIAQAIVGLGEIGARSVNRKSAATSSDETHEVARSAAESTGGATEVQQPSKQITVDPLTINAQLETRDTTLADLLNSPNLANRMFAQDVLDSSPELSKAHAEAVSRAHSERRGRVTLSEEKQSTSRFKTEVGRAAFAEVGWAISKFEMSNRWNSFNDWVGGLTEISDALQHDIDLRRAALVENDRYVAELNAIADAEVGKVVFVGAGIGASVGGFAASVGIVATGGLTWSSGTFLAYETDQVISTIRTVGNGLDHVPTFGGSGLSLTPLGSYGELAYDLGPALLAIPNLARSGHNLIAGTSGAAERPLFSSGSALDSIPLSRSPELGSVSTTAELLERGLIPGSQGVTLGQRTVAFSDVWKLSEMHGAEFALTREAGAWRLYSGGASRVSTPLGADVRVLAHTHPGGTRLPSRGDIDALDFNYDQRLAANPSALPYPSRVIYGPGTQDYTPFWPTNR